MDSKVVDRFWKKVDRTSDGCWEWQACRVHGKYRGYGRFGYKGKTENAHRVAYELTYGPIPAGLFVCHRCDNPPCCRPDHLFLGTAGDNVRDAFAKGRLRRPSGEQHPCSRLTDDEVATIRQRAAAGERFVDIAPDFGITPTYAGQLVADKSRRQA